MNNLPSNLRRHTVFRDNEYSHTVVFQDGYILPAQNEIKMQVRYNGRILTDIDPEISVTGQRVTFTYSPELLAKIPALVQQYLVLSGRSLVGGELGILIGYGDQDISETQVTITEGEVTVVEVTGLALVHEQAIIATEKAAQTAADALQTAGDRTQTGLDRIATAADRVQTGEDRTAAISAKDAAEAARDIALANTVERIYVDTYAEAEPYFTGPMPREVYVAADEANYEGDPSWYKYDPQLGTALLGIDFNYTED